jgi:uncharacterized delta-60 repeat protein
VANLGESMGRFIKYSVLLGVFIGIMTARAFFGGRGDFPGDSVNVVAIQQDGKALIAGHFNPGKIMRRNVDGSLDSSFTSSWTADGFNAPVKALVIQPDQKILVGGEFSRFDISLAGYIARLNPDGSIDRDFMKNTGIGFDDVVTSIRTWKDGKIWVGGRFKSFNGTPIAHLARLNPDGTLDRSFRNQQKLDNAVNEVFMDEKSGQVTVVGVFSGRMTSVR